MIKTLKTSNFIHSVALIFNVYSISALVILLTLIGEAGLASDISVTQGAIFSLLFTFSASSRNLILQNVKKSKIDQITLQRFFLIIPLSVVAYYMTYLVTTVDRVIIIIVIIRSIISWLCEVHITHLELKSNFEQVKKYLILDFALLIMAFIWIKFKFFPPEIGLFIWALSPLFLISNYLLSLDFRTKKIVSIIPLSFSPYLGSSAVIGFSVYVFRLVVLCKVGKYYAGNLFAAFAIGGMASNIFTNILGPSLIFKNINFKNLNKKLMPLSFSFLLLLVLSALLLNFSINITSYIKTYSKAPLFFWQTVIYSLIGGLIMTNAQYIKLRILWAKNLNNNTFSPDVLINVILIILIPFGYSIIGDFFIYSLYLISSLLTFIFYYSYQLNQINLKENFASLRRKVLVLIPVMILIPIFFQYENGIFSTPILNFNHEGNLKLVPFPLSLITCFLSIIFISEYRKFSTLFIFSTFVLMAITTIISTLNNVLYQDAKFILLSQFMIPMFGLILGGYYPDAHKKIIEKSFLYSLFFIIPTQLITSWLSKSSILIDKVALFNIYQFHEYVCVIYVAAYLFVLFGLFDEVIYRSKLLALSFIMSIYTAASLSMSAAILFFSGLVVFVFIQRDHNPKKVMPLLMCMCMCLISACYFLFRSEYFNYSFLISIESQIVEILAIWKYFFIKLIDDTSLAFIGRDFFSTISSPYKLDNYYLEFILQFGLISFSPFLLLILFTFNLILKNRNMLSKSNSNSNSLIGLIFITFFLLLIENIFSHSLREPFSGIFIFFLWGVLLSKLSLVNLEKKHAI